MTSISTEVITDDAAFQALEVEWNGLVSVSPSRTVFLTHVWLLTWWRIYGPGLRLHIITARHGDRLVGIAPLYEEPATWIPGLGRARLRFLGDGEVSSDYLDFLVDPEHEREALEALCERMVEAGPRRAWLQAALSTSLVRRGLDALGRQGRIAWRESNRTECPYIPLPATMEEFMERPDTLFKSIIRRELKARSKKHSIEPVFPSDEETIAGTIDRLFELNRLRWKEEGQSGAFTSPRKREFYLSVSKALADRDMLGLAALRLDGEIAAVQFGVRYDGTYYASQMGRDPALDKLKVGNLLQMHLMQSLVGSHQEFNALRGGTRHKYDWGGRDRHTADLFFWRGPAARLAAAAFSAVRTGRRTARIWLKEGYAKEFAGRLFSSRSWAVLVGARDRLPTEDQLKHSNRHIQCGRWLKGPVGALDEVLSPDWKRRVGERLGSAPGLVVTVGGVPVVSGRLVQGRAERTDLGIGLTPGEGIALLEGLCFYRGYARPDWLGLLVANAVALAAESDRRLVCLIPGSALEDGPGELDLEPAGDVSLNRVFGWSRSDTRALEPFLADGQSR